MSFVYPCISLKERRRGHGIGEARPGTNEAPSWPRTRCWRSFLKKGKREMEAMCISYISMFMFRLDTYAAEPWYLGTSLYIRLPCISYWLLLQHVRANKASLQTLSVSSLLVPLHQLLRVDQQHRYRPVNYFTFMKINSCLSNLNFIKFIFLKNLHHEKLRTLLGCLNVISKF